MIRRIVSIMLGAAVALFGQAPKAAAAKGFAWQTSWSSFVAAYNACIKDTRCDQKRLVDHEVVWEGTVEKIDLATFGVGLKMAGPAIHDNNGTPVDELSFLITPEGADLEKWKNISIGQKVRFRTKTSGGFTGSPVSCMDVTKTVDGKVAKKVVMALVFTTGGQLIRSWSEGK